MKERTAWARRETQGDRRAETGNHQLKYGGRSRSITAYPQRWRLSRLLGLSSIIHAQATASNCKLLAWSPPAIPGDLLDGLQWGHVQLDSGPGFQGRAPEVGGQIWLRGAAANRRWRRGRRAARWEIKRCRLKFLAKAPDLDDGGAGTGEWDGGLALATSRRGALGVLERSGLEMAWEMADVLMS